VAVVFAVTHRAAFDRIALRDYMAVSDFFLAISPISPDFSSCNRNPLFPKKIYDRHKSFGAKMGRLFCLHTGRCFNNRLSIGQRAGFYKSRLVRRCTGSPGTSGCASPACDTGTGRNGRVRCSGCRSGCGDPAGSH
jgi:hypothetical protein